MQSIAFELGIAETAFLVPDRGPDTFGLRWFSPAIEIDLCGHATLASAHALRQCGHGRRRRRRSPSTPGAARCTPPSRATASSLDFPADPITATARCPGASRGSGPASVAELRPDGVLHLRRRVVGRGRARPTSPTSRPSRPPAPRRSSSPRRPIRPPAPTTCCGSSGPTSASTRTRRRARPSARPARTGRRSWGGATWWPASCLGAGATLYVRPEGERVRIAGCCNHGADGSPVLISAHHGRHHGGPAGTGRGSRAGVASGGRGQGALPRASWPGCRRRATSTPTPPTSPPRPSSWAPAARCCTCTSVSASGCSPAATSTPARHPPSRPGARRPRSSASPSSIRRAARSCSISTCTRRRSATPISTCATCCSPATTTRIRRRARAPTPAGAVGTRRWRWPTSP